MSQDSDRVLLSTLSRHLIAISGLSRDVRRDKLFPFAYSGCVVASGNGWFILTAGHSIAEYLENVESGLAEVSESRLIDGSGKDSKFPVPIPFTIENRPCDFIDNEVLGLDYAILSLRQNEIDLLSANEIEPLQLVPPPSRDAIKYSDFAIVGFPAERVSFRPVDDSEGFMCLQPHFIPIESLESDKSTLFHRFKGRIKDLGEIESIVGISGGPLFGFSQLDENCHYWLFGIQSRWDRQSHTVFACTLEAICNHLVDETVLPRCEARNAEIQ